ncbi:TPA: hypothetical protein I7682_17695 [Vibrio vulnificus]|nr:hypothetical protein [Vibrio vulnificus]
MKNTKYMGVILSLFIVTMLSACSISDAVDEQSAQIDLQAEKLNNITTRKDKYNRIRFVDSFYVSELSQEAIALPGWYSKRVTQKLTGVELEKAVQQLAKKEQITVDMTDLTAEDRRYPVSIVLTDEPLGKALKTIANLAGLAMTYENGRAVYSKYERRVFPIATLPGRESIAIGRDGGSTVASSSTSGVNSGIKSSGNSQFSNIRVEGISAIEDLSNNVKTVLSKEGEVTFSEISSFLVVKDYPSNVAQAEKIINEFNGGRTQQVEVLISLIDIIKTEDNRLGLDYTAALELFGDRVLFGSSGSFTTGANGTISPSSFSFKIIGGSADGSKVMADALSRKGSVSRTVFQRVIALNGAVGTVKAVTKEFYIAEQTGNNTTSGGIITGGGTRQELLETGQILNILPRIHNDDVILKINSSISANLGITTKLNEDTGTFVESPKVADMEWDMSTIVEDGYTMVIGGLNVDSEIVARSKAGYKALGFSESGSSENKETIMTISVNITRGKSRG